MVSHGISTSLKPALASPPLSVRCDGPAQPGLATGLAAPCRSRRLGVPCTSWCGTDTQPGGWSHALSRGLYASPTWVKVGTSKTSLTFPGPEVNLVSFPVLSQIKPQAPLLVVPFRQFL